MQKENSDVCHIPIKGAVTDPLLLCLNQLVFCCVTPTNRFLLNSSEKLVSDFCEQERRHNLVVKSHWFSSIRAVTSSHRDHGKPTWICKVSNTEALSLESCHLIWTFLLLKQIWISAKMIITKNPALCNLKWILYQKKKCKLRTWTLHLFWTNDSFSYWDLSPGKRESPLMNWCHVGNR